MSGEEQRFTLSSDESTPHSDDFIIQRHPSLANQYVISTRDAAAQLAFESAAEAIGHVWFAAAKHGVRVWLTEDGRTYQRVAGAATNVRLRES